MFAKTKIGSKAACSPYKEYTAPATLNDDEAFCSFDIPAQRRRSAQRERDRRERRIRPPPPKGSRYKEIDGSLQRDPATEPPVERVVKSRFGEAAARAKLWMGLTVCVLCCCNQS